MVFLLEIDYVNSLFRVCTLVHRDKSYFNILSFQIYIILIPKIGYTPNLVTNSPYKLLTTNKITSYYLLMISLFELLLKIQ